MKGAIDPFKLSCDHLSGISRSGDGKRMTEVLLSLIEHRVLRAPK
jgi:hypothetical protein